MNGLPGIILAGALAVTAVSAWVREREQRAVDRAAWVHSRDSLRNVIVAESLAADSRTRQRDDSIARLNARLNAATASAAASGRRFETASAALHAIVDSNQAAREALDSLESAHGQQVKSLQEAVAAAQAQTRVALAAVADRDAQLAKLRSSYADAIARADKFERDANPGWLRRVVESPETHIVAALIGAVVS